MGAPDLFVSWSKVSVRDRKLLRDETPKVNCRGKVHNKAEEHGKPCAEYPLNLLNFFLQKVSSKISKMQT